MKPSLQLKIGHNLIMTPQLQQAIRLLQLSSMELSVEIQEALESNMMLETDEESSEEQSGSENSEENPSPIENILDATQDIASAPELENIPDELAVDSVWEDTYESNANESSGNISTNYENSQLNYENQNCNNETLKEHLLWQLNLMPISDTDKAIATTIIDALDDDGYLNCDLDDIHASLGDEIKTKGTDGEKREDDGSEIGLDEIEAVLHMIQALEPTGVGARNLQECLLLQLRQGDKDTPFLATAIELVSKHLDLLARRDFNQLMRKLKLDQEKLQDIIVLIQTMNPRPGGHIHEAHTEYITPDVYVKKVNGRYHDRRARALPARSGGHGEICHGQHCTGGAVSARGPGRERAIRELFLHRRGQRGPQPGARDTGGAQAGRNDSGRGLDGNRAGAPG